MLVVLKVYKTRSTLAGSFCYFTRKSIAIFIARYVFELYVFLFTYFLLVQLDIL